MPIQRMTPEMLMAQDITQKNTAKTFHRAIRSAILKTD
jgi:hypothetical protein